MHKPRRCAAEGLLCMTKYLRGTRSMGYRRSVDEHKAHELLVCVDADWAGGEHVRSMSGVRIQ